MSSKRYEGGGAAPLSRAWLARLLPKRAGDYAGLVLAAAIAGIVANALMFQRERHPTPFFSASAPSAPTRPPAPPIDPPAPAIAPPVADVTPPARPAALDVAPPTQATAAAKPRDPIGAFLRGGARDRQRLIATAQTALIKLGYAVKGGSALGAETLAAMRDYEKAHGLPVSTEITPRGVKQIAAAANASTSR